MLLMASGKAPTPGNIIPSLFKITSLSDVITDFIPKKLSAIFYTF